MKETLVWWQRYQGQAMIMVRPGTTWPTRQMKLRLNPNGSSTTGLELPWYPVESMSSHLLRCLAWILRTPVGGPKLFVEPRETVWKFKATLSWVK